MSSCFLYYLNISRIIAFIADPIIPKTTNESPIIAVSVPPKQKCLHNTPTIAPRAMYNEYTNEKEANMMMNCLFRKRILNSSIKGLDYPSLFASAEGGVGGSFHATKYIGISKTVSMKLYISK